MRRILPLLSRGALTNCHPGGTGRGNAPIGHLRSSSIAELGTVPNWERKPNRPSFVPPIANLGRRVLRHCNGADQWSTGLRQLSVPPKTGPE
jgi:hypothetical protein